MSDSFKVQRPRVPLAHRPSTVTTTTTTTTATTKTKQKQTTDAATGVGKAAVAKDAWLGVDVKKGRDGLPGSAILDVLGPQQFAEVKCVRKGEASQLEGLFFVDNVDPHAHWWFKDGSSNFRGYSYAVPDQKELAEISAIAA